MYALASLCSWAGRFVSYLVANPEDRFSRDVAQIMWYSDLQGVKMHFLKPTSDTLR